MISYEQKIAQLRKIYSGHVSQGIAEELRKILYEPFTQKSRSNPAQTTLPFPLISIIKKRFLDRIRNNPEIQCSGFNFRINSKLNNYIIHKNSIEVFNRFTIAFSAEEDWQKIGYVAVYNVANNDVQAIINYLEIVGIRFHIHKKDKTIYIEIFDFLEYFT